jgi:hypothetical protein
MRQGQDKFAAAAARDVRNRRYTIVGFFVRFFRRMKA